MWWSRSKPDRTPQKKHMLSMADVGSRLLFGRRAFRWWMEDRDFERNEFKAMWKPFKGFLEHLIVLLVMNLTCLCRLDRLMFSTHNALDDFFSDNHFTDVGPINQMIVFSEIDTLERLWLFVEHIAESIANYDPPGLTPENMMVGKMRFRQLRVKPSPCIISRWPELAGRYNTCHGFYALDIEDKDPFGLGDEPWTYRLNPEGHPSFGYFFDYSADGYWIDFSRTFEVAKEEIKTLKNNSWIDEATRAVFLDLVSYNANCDEICYMWIRFEIPPGGGVVPFQDTFCSPFNQYATEFDFWRLNFEILFALCTVLVTFSELKKIIVHRGRLLDIYWSVFNLLKVVELVACWLTLWFSAQRFLHASRLLNAMQEEGLAVSQRSDLIYFYDMWGKRWLSSAMFVAWLRTFHYQRVTTQVLVTLQRSRGALIGYFVMYVLLHGAFAIAGHYLFGNQLFVFKTFSSSALSILEFALGEMSSDETLGAFWLTGPVFFLLLIFILIFVFHNMFFVILSYNYDSVREERSLMDRGLDFGAFMHNGYLNIRKKMGLRMKPFDANENLERRLLKCGFSLGSVQTFRTLLLPKQGITTAQAEVTVKDLKLVEDEIELMENQLLQAKNELSNLVSSLSGELHSSDD